jgi:hypothetical protein
VLVTGAAVFVVSWRASPEVQAGFGYACCWFLLLGGIRPIFELSRRRRRVSDIDQLARLTRVPAGLWQFLFVVIALAALALSAWLLTPGAVRL